MHYGLEGLVDENTYFCNLPKSRQADSLRDFYCDTDNRAEMWAEMQSPTKSCSWSIATRMSIDYLLEVALTADLTGTEDAKAEAFRQLGERLANFAYNYAERRLDAYIEDNLEDLMLDESDLRANAMGV